MKKQQMFDLLDARCVKYLKSWNKTQLQTKIDETAHIIAIFQTTKLITPSRNWYTAKDYFPYFDIDQKLRSISITFFETKGYQKKASITTKIEDIDLSEQGDCLIVRGTVDCKNYVNWQASNTQSFCYIFYIKESNQIYKQRTPATKGWMHCSADSIKKRLYKFGYID